MLRATFWLTLVTLCGLLLGFAREWLLVAAWGAGARSDAFLVAMFLPEAVRMSLAAGLLAAALLPLLAEQPAARLPRWLAGHGQALLLLGSVLALVVGLGAPLWVRLMGPGLGAASWQAAAGSLSLLAISLPLLLLHALAAAVGQARQRFLLAGLGSVFYNLPPVLLLACYGAAVDERVLALGFVAGALLMLLSVLPLLWSAGWRPWLGNSGPGDVFALYRRLGPLLLSACSSQLLALLERLVASWLGEGAITLVNLARKLVNLPLMALGSLNQVLLAAMVRQGDAERTQTLRLGLLITAVLTVPAAVGLVAAAPVLVDWLLPAGLGQGPLPALLAWFACVIVFGSWNALLARQAYAAGDTLTPLRCELAGNVLTAAGLLLLPALGGLAGIAWASLLGCLLTGVLLLRHTGMLGDALLQRLPLLSVTGLLLAAGLQQLSQGGWQLLLASLHALAWLLLLGLWARQQYRTAYSNA